MKTLVKLAWLVSVLLLPIAGYAQSDAGDEAEALKIAAIEALISAPPERALPMVTKVLSGNHSDQVKERALFILSQIESPESQAILVKYAGEESGALQLEAVRMIGIGGDKEALASLAAIYQSGSPKVRKAVLEAYLIAEDKEAIFAIAGSAKGEEFEEAVQMLGAMGAHEELRALRTQAGVSESLIDAYAISDDFESLRELALDGSNPEMQVQAIEAMGIVDGEETEAALLEIYRGAASKEVREAALQGLLISDNDTGVMELYRSSQDPVEKKRLLEYLVMMDSDEVWNIIDATLDGEP
jgi:HEAT repeat protein